MSFTLPELPYAYEALQLIDENSSSSRRLGGPRSEIWPKEGGAPHFVQSQIYS